jgi:hypothetical protein
VPRPWLLSQADVARLQHKTVGIIASDGFWWAMEKAGNLNMVMESWYQVLAHHADATPQQAMGIWAGLLQARTEAW